MPGRKHENRPKMTVEISGGGYRLFSAPPKKLGVNRIGSMRRGQCHTAVGIGAGLREVPGGQIAARILAALPIAPSTPTGKPRRTLATLLDTGGLRRGTLLTLARLGGVK
jgi:hypothetical protein